MKCNSAFLCLFLVLFVDVEGAAVDYKLNQIPQAFNQDNTKVESDPADCVDLQLQRNHQQLSLLNATTGTVSVTLTYESAMTTDTCKEVIAAFNTDRLASQPDDSATYKFGKSYQCSDGAANAEKCTYTCECSEAPCQVITLIGAGEKAKTESGTWRICRVEVTE